MRLSTILFAALMSAATATTANAQFVTINELYYDAPSTDDGKVFIELAGPAGLDISGWRIVQVQGNNSQCGNYTNTVILPNGSVIQPDGLFVVVDLDGAGNTSVVIPPQHNSGAPDYAVGNADFENGPDAVSLLDSGGTLIDSVLYGTIPCGTDQSGNLIGEGAAAFDVFGGFSLERFPAGFDTFNNANDFFENATPSPGEAGVPPASLIYTNVGGVGNSISLAAGGQLDLRVRIASPNDQYLILAGVTPPTGSDPLGIPFDPVTDVFINLAAIPNPLVVNFVGNLSGNGLATGSLVLPPNIATLPFPVSFYFVALAPVSLAGTKTNVVTFDLTP